MTANHDMRTEDHTRSADDSDTVPAGTPGSAENVCRHCAGTGKVEGSTCPVCEGSGIVITPVGGAG